MKKVCYLFIVFFFAQSALFAQQTKSSPFEEIKDGEYTIRILPAPGNTFGYDILKGEQVILHQQFNPFAKGRSMTGLKNKADVIILTKWLVTESKRTGKHPPSMLQDKIAQDLKISVQ